MVAFMPTNSIAVDGTPAAAGGSGSTPVRQLKMAASSSHLRNSHLSYILSVAFSTDGRRFATVSADRTVRIWDLDSDGSWTYCGPGGANEWQAHKGPVKCVNWAHPEFGQLIATAGSDHAVTIWEERDGSFKSLATPERTSDGFLSTSEGGGGSGASAAATTSSWIQKATLSDARRAVSCVEFSPRHLGLRLAAASADGAVRIYEALDTMNLSHWKLDGVIEDAAKDGSGPSPSQRHLQSSGGGVGSGGASPANSNEDLGVTSLSWCNGRFEPPTLVTGHSSSRVSVYRYDDSSRSWVEAIRLPNHATEGGVPRGVLDVAWAPNVGRSYHLIASCGKDNSLKVHRIKRGRVGSRQQAGGDGNGGGSAGGSSSALVYEDTQVLDRGEAWRCQWNVTGTVLASSVDGGSVRLWKSDFRGQWRLVSEAAGGAVDAAASAQNQ